jgi:homoserine acetyltransferase
MKDEAVLQIIRETPGATGFEIYCAIRDQWRKTSRLAQWLGNGSYLVELIGPSFGGMYTALWRLEDKKLVRSEWGVATANRGWRRPRHYYSI